MKINSITALDYKAQDGLLEATLTGTTLEEITARDTTVLTVQTDAGDLVEALAGYALRSVTFNVEDGTFRTILALGTADTTAATLSKLAGDLEEARGEVAALKEANTALAGQLEQLTGAIERGLTV